MNTAPTNTAHSLYVLYETLPNEVQQAFLQELMQKKTSGAGRPEFLSGL
jgi:hypothetical protein